MLYQKNKWELVKNKKNRINVNHINVNKVGKVRLYNDIKRSQIQENDHNKIKSYYLVFYF